VKYKLLKNLFSRKPAALIAFLIALAAAVDSLRPLPRTTFAIEESQPAPAPSSGQQRGPVIHDLPNPAASAHSASLVDLGEQQLGAAWFSGSREGASDVSIVFSRFDGTQWQAPRVIASNEKLQDDQGRITRKLGNPVLWLDKEARLHLWFVSVAYGGWAGSSINHQISYDKGASWQPAEKLITSPFWNLSTLVRTPPLPLSDGGFALPVYHEFISKYSEWLRLDHSGKVVDKLRIDGARHQIQPSAVALAPNQAIMVTRDAGSGQNAIHVSLSDDAGRHWSNLEAVKLANPNASVALLRLNDGRLLLAYNPQESSRQQLALALSSDGKSWSPAMMLEVGQDSDEFSYPALLQDHAGMIHVAYTWKRTHIRLQSFTSEFLDSQAVKSRPVP